MRRRSGFTLVELLVVIAIVSVLSVVVIMTLNPAELLKRSRDSTRLSDLQNLNTAIGSFQADGSSSFMGTSSIVYISIPDSTTTCANLGLPTLGATWSYRCSAAADFRKVDGTGWVPINFAGMSFNSPFGTLPVDPVNATSSGRYYAYTAGSWEFTAAAESSRYVGISNAAGSDGGSSWTAFEVGTDLTLMPPQVISSSGADTSLIAYWPFDDNTGSSAQDISGYENTGTLVNSPDWTASCKVGGCLEFDASVPNRVEAPDSADWDNITSQITLMAWVRPASGSLAARREIVKRSGTTDDWWMNLQNSGKISFYAANITGGAYIQSTNTISEDVWTHVAVSYTGAAVNLYINGVLDRSVAATGNFEVSNDAVTVAVHGASFTGFIDDVRIYSRGLSGQEIFMIYNSAR